jgi:hypothetical protein
LTRLEAAGRIRTSSKVKASLLEVFMCASQGNSG